MRFVAKQRMVIGGNVIVPGETFDADGSGLDSDTLVTFMRRDLAAPVSSGGGDDGGVPWVRLTQAEYDALEEPDENTLYLIVEDEA